MQVKWIVSSPIIFKRVIGKPHGFQPSATRGSVLEVTLLECDAVRAGLFWRLWLSPRSVYAETTDVRHRHRYDSAKEGMFLTE